MWLSRFVRRRAARALCSCVPLLCVTACLSVALLATFGCPGSASGEIIQATLVPDSSDPGKLIDPHPNGYSIQEIIAAGGIQIGDKVFDSFNLTSSGSGFRSRRGRHPRYARRDSRGRGAAWRRLRHDFQRRMERNGRTGGQLHD